MNLHFLEPKLLTFISVKKYFSTFRLIIAALIIFLPNFIFAQFTGTLVPSESICISNGSVKVNSADPSSIYILTGAGVPQTSFGPGSTSYTYLNLPAGVYTVTEVQSDNQEFTSTTTVTTTYEQNWQFTADVSFINCSGGNPGSICVKVTGITNATSIQQRPPYTYRISAPNGTLPPDGTGSPVYGTNPEFCFTPSVAQGKTFQLQTKDNCGNFKTYNIQVPNNPPPPSLNATYKGFTDCSGKSKYTITAAGGTGPYTTTIISGPDQVGNSSSTNPTNFDLLPLSTYVFEIKDQCGGTIKKTITTTDYTPPCIYTSGSEGTCDPLPNGTGAQLINICTTGIGPFSLLITSNCGYSQTINNVSEYTTISNLPRPCSYTVVVTDGCGKTNTATFELIPPGVGTLQCGFNILCPDQGSDKVKVRNYMEWSKYVAKYPLSITLKDVNNNIVAGYPQNMNYSSYENIQALDPGTYSYYIVDQCGATCEGIFDVPTYSLPTITVDVNHQCYGSGVITLVGVNNNPISSNSYSYQIIAGPTDVWKTSEVPDVTNQGKFSKLLSGGTYTFTYNDGCQNVSIDATVPEWQQPTYEVSYGLVCPPVTQGDVQIFNLQPANLKRPYYWQIIGTNSDAYGSTAPYNGTLPYPPLPGSLDSLFAGLPPNLDNSTATYTIQGYDACGNSYLNAAKVGLFPEETLILDKISFCNGPGVTLKARVSDFIVGAKYEYYRDGILVASSNKLFTTISPALPGVYKAKIIAGIAPNTCEKETPEVVVSTIAELKINSLINKCSDGTADITLPEITLGSTSGTLSYYKDSALTMAIPDPTMIATAGKYYIHLVTNTSPICDIIGAIQIKDSVCCAINNANLVVGNCNSNYTLTNADDDTFTFTLDPTGDGIATSYLVTGLPNSPITANYGAPTTFGPYLIKDGVLNITITDANNSTCKTILSVTPPNSCSVCNVTEPLLSVNDNICPNRTGTINLVQVCGAGTFNQYSINNGITWSTVKPLYSTIPLTILVRCVNSIDTTCKSLNSTVTTNPKKCSPKDGESCSITANATIDPCNNNGTNDFAADDYFTIQINAAADNGGSSNKYEVVIGADQLTGLGGNILNSSGTAYGSPATIGNTKIFKADGISTYQLVVRDINNNNCFQLIDISSVPSCSDAPAKSPCYPVPCVPIGMNKN